MTTLHHRAFHRESKAALEGALHEAIALGSNDVTTGHLLLGMLRAPDSAAARLLAGLGQTPDAIRAAVLRQDVSEATAPPGVDLPPAPEPPGRAGLALRMIAALAWVAAVGAVIMLASAPDASGVLTACLVGVPALTGLVVVPLLPLRARRIRARLARSAGLGLPALPGLAELVARRGVRDLELRAQTNLQVRNRSYRAGRRAWIVLAPATMRDPVALRFVLAHEVAHVLRNDSLRRLVTQVLALDLLYAGVIGGTGRSLLAAVLGALALEVGGRWAAEFGCDAYAVRWCGIGGMRAWAGGHEALLRQPQNRLLRRRLRRSLAVLTHPPIRLRLRVAARSVVPG